MSNNTNFGHRYVKGMDVELHLLSKGRDDGIPVIFLPGITSYSRSMARLEPVGHLPERQALRFEQQQHVV